MKVLRWVALAYVAGLGVLLVLLAFGDTAPHPGASGTVLIVGMLLLAAAGILGSAGRSSG